MYRTIWAEPEGQSQVGSKRRSGRPDAVWHPVRSRCLKKGQSLTNRRPIFFLEFSHHNRLRDITATLPYEGGGKLSPLYGSRPSVQRAKYASLLFH
jgi:hypothetical protein